MQKWSFEELPLKGAYKIASFYAPDNRGGFCKDFSAEVFEENKIQFNIQEIFYTYSLKGVIRAIHFQNVFQQPKLVRCIKGHIYDVIVDLRKESPTFKKWMGFDLTEGNHLELLIPERFGHGYLVLEDSIVSYKCSEKFYAKYDSRILWNDPDLNIAWPLELIGGEKNLIISEKDKNLQSFKNFEKTISE